VSIGAGSDQIAASSLQLGGRHATEIIAPPGSAEIARRTRAFRPEILEQSTSK